MTEIQISDNDIDELITEHNAAISDRSRYWDFDESRRSALKGWEDVQACPGSGKTTLVAAKLLILTKKWQRPFEGICVLTHTNVAKNEIISKLLQHPSGCKLTAYPHFVGTIQEFINKFLALPHIRSAHQFCRVIDESEGKREVCKIRSPVISLDDICRNLYRTCARASYDEIKGYLGSIHYRNAQKDIGLFIQNGSFLECRADSSSQRRQLLMSLKEALCASGIFQYRDMYAFAEMLVGENRAVIEAVRQRFPIVLLDEMQDVQEFQDKIIQLLFPSTSVACQRFGDPDQAIYDGIGGEEPNASYNSRSNLSKIDSTHRFGEDISEKIVGLSYNGLNRISSKKIPERSNFLHTILLFDDNTRSNVLGAYSYLVASSDPVVAWADVRAVGGVDGSSGEIKKYWAVYDKKHEPQSFKPDTLYSILRMDSSNHSSAQYGLIFQGIVDLLRVSNCKFRASSGQERYFTKTSFTEFLNSSGKFVELRKLIAKWILSPPLEETEWNQDVETLLRMVGLSALNEDAQKFLAFSFSEMPTQDHAFSIENIYTSPNGRKIKVGTIHSVKGETHDATLILETKFNRLWDVKEMIPYMLDPSMHKPPFDPASDNNDSKRAKFMRKLYVAGSRPRNLLCMAIHKDNITGTQLSDLISNLGWSVASVLPSVQHGA